MIDEKGLEAARKAFLSTQGNWVATLEAYEAAKPAAEPVAGGLVVSVRSSDAANFPGQRVKAHGDGWVVTEPLDASQIIGARVAPNEKRPGPPKRNRA